MENNKIFSLRCGDLVIINGKVTDIKEIDSVSFTVNYRIPVTELEGIPITETILELIEIKSDEFGRYIINTDYGCPFWIENYEPGKWRLWLDQNSYTFIDDINDLKEKCSELIYKSLDVNVLIGKTKEELI